MNEIVSLIAVVTGIILLDGVWLTANYKMYRRLVTRVQDSPMIINLYGAVASYLLLTLLIWKVAVPLAASSLWYPFVIGICTYGIFNATNYAIFKNYDIIAAVLDTLWGGILVLLTSLWAKYLSSQKVF
jgi:uncharacterized membrane protein